ncbi:MAG: M48 family metallopeptidase [Catalinimonas sp.]
MAPVLPLRLGRMLIAGVVAIVTLIGYYSTSQDNPVTGEKQYIDITAEQEIALGMQAVPRMAQQHGGFHPDQDAQALVDRVGNRIVQSTAAGQTPYAFEFHLLADDQTVNAFALPGGQVFITAALLARFDTEDQLAGVLGHEIGHVVGRHSAEQMAKTKLTQGLTGAAVIATYDPSNPSTQQSAAMAAMVGQMVNMKHGREDELESDELGVRFMIESGYDPRALIDVMRILAEAGGGSRQPEFFSTHPNPDNRIANIEEAIRQYSGS